MALSIADPPSKIRSPGTGPRVAVLVNASGGTVEHLGAQAVRAELETLFAERGMTVRVDPMRGNRLQEAAQDARAAARRNEIDGVVVGGGDGTINTVAAVLADSGVPLGVLPLGTLNHFAKDLGIPLDLPGAVDIIGAGNVRAVDLGEVNQRVFINNSSIGVYPSMVLDRERRRSQDGRSKWVAMFLAALHLFRQVPVRRLSICIEGRTTPFHTPCLFVGNNEYGLALASFGQRERLDGGKLCFYISTARSRASLLRLACRSALGRAEEEQDLQTTMAPTAEIRARTSRLLISLDGEVATMRPPLRYRIRPAALRVFAPAAPEPKPSASE